MEKLDLPIDEHPGVAVLPRFKSPSWLESQTTKIGIDVVGATTVYFGRMALPQFVEKYRGTKLKGTLQYQPTSFARMIAKIAFGYCVGRFGLNSVRRAYILPAILGRSEDVGTWVGSTEGYRLKLDTQPDERITHAVGTDVINGDIVAYVRLFAWAAPDEYVVVVAPVPNDHNDDAMQNRTLTPNTR
jgi:hypothetical protein